MPKLIISLLLLSLVVGCNEPQVLDSESSSKARELCSTRGGLKDARVEYYSANFTRVLATCNNGVRVSVDFILKQRIRSS